MPDFHHLNVNFNGGELSPLMNARVDFDGYRSGCVQMENFMVRPYGGAFKSPGTQYIGEVKDSSKKVRLVPMKISRSENYILEVGAGYFRFWKEAEPAYLQIKSGYSVPAHSTSTTYELGDLVVVSTVNYVRVGNGHKTDSSFAAALAAGYWHALTGSIIQWPNSYTEADLAEIQWQQVNRLIVITHARHAPLLVESVPVNTQTGDFIRNTAWSDAATTAVTYSFLIATAAFIRPPLTDHPLSSSNKTVTATYAAAAWASGVGYTAGTMVKVASTWGAASIIYICTVGHTSGGTTEPGTGGSWATVWRLATGAEVEYTLTASDSTVFAGLVAGELFGLRSIASPVQVSMVANGTRYSIPMFLQGGFTVSTEWASGTAPDHSLFLEESLDGVTFQTVVTWKTTNPATGTVLYNGTAPTQGAWYRLRADVAALSAGTLGKIEPVQADVTLLFTIDTVTSSTVLKAKSALPFKGIPTLSTTAYAATEFFLAAFSASAGYPAAVGLHNLRLWFGGTDLEPNKVRASMVDDFFNFATGDLDSDGFDITLNSNESNKVQWISGYRQGLVVGTEGEEWTIQGGGDGSEVLKPTNIQAIRRNRAGSKRISAIQTRDALLWVSLTGRKVYEFAYVFASDNYESPDMTLRAEHITASGIVDVAFQNEPDPVLWCVLANGTLLGFSYNRSNQIAAWFRRTTLGSFESIASVRSAGDADRVWMVVKRTINGQTKRYIERFYPTSQAFDFSTASDMCYVDCAKKITQASSTAVSGLTHLEGAAVKVWADGARIESKTVASGAITLATAAATAFVGLPYTSTLQPEPIELVLQDGTAQGRRFNAQRIHLALHASMGGSLSNDPATPGYAIVYPTGTTGVYTGHLNEHVTAEWKDGIALTFTHADPTPFNLLGFVLKAEISGS